MIDMCEDEKTNMVERLAVGNEVVTSYGVWHTQGHLCKNGSFINKIYLTGGLLWQEKGQKLVGGSEVNELF